MIGVVVARSHHIDEVEPFRGDDALRHADVRLVCRSVFMGEGIGEIGIEEQVVALPLDEKTALPQPPDVQVVWVIASGKNVGEKFIVLEKWLNHSPRKLGTRGEERCPIGNRGET